MKEALNSLISTFDDRMGRVKSLLSELKSLVDMGEENNSAKIQNLVRKLTKELDRFKVTSGPDE